MDSFNQLTRYLLVGGFVTLADMALYNALTGDRRHMPRIQANLISTTVGMFLGFILHYALVFHPAEAALPARIVKYIATIGFSVYVVQNAVIYALAKLWRGPVQFVQAVHGQINFRPHWSNDFLDRITGKLAAALAGMAWNFVMFKFFVYSS